MPWTTCYWLALRIRHGLSTYLYPLLPMHNITYTNEDTNCKVIYLNSQQVNTCSVTIPVQVLHCVQATKLCLKCTSV